MSRNDEDKAVSVISFISSSLWYIEDFLITNITIEKLTQTRFTNPGYRSENLQRYLEKTYDTELKVIKMDSKGKVTNIRYCFL
jgi:hypothetical protein